MAVSYTHLDVYKRQPDPGLGASSKHPNLEVNLENSLLSNEGCKNEIITVMFLLRKVTIQ